MEKLCRGEGTPVDPEGSCGNSDGLQSARRNSKARASILFKEPLSHFSPSFAKNSSGGDAGQDISEFFGC